MRPPRRRTENSILSPSPSEDGRTELRGLVTAIATSPSPDEFDRERFRTLCTHIAEHSGPESLAEIFQSADGGRSLSPDTALNLLDALRGRNGVILPAGQIMRLLETLRIDWASFDGNEFGDLFSTLLMLTKASQDHASVAPGDAGLLLNKLMEADSFQISPQDLAAAVQFLWEEGFSWGVALAEFLAKLLPTGWAVQHSAALVCYLAQGCIDADELDLIDFEAVDKAEVDSHNPAVKIGLLLNAIVPRQEQSVSLAAEVTQALHQEFGEAQVEEPGQGGPWQRAALFAGRVLQQLRNMQEGGAGSAAGDWRLEEAVQLACSLCAGPRSGNVDWRTGRNVHAYFVGDIMKQLRKGEGKGHTSLNLLTERSSLI